MVDTDVLENYQILLSKTFKMRIIVTGGSGFIGSALIRIIINKTDHEVLNIDKLTYAGHLESLEDASGSDQYQFEQVDICDADKINRIFNKFQPDAIIHLAAEFHVDRTIDGSAEFIKTKVNGIHTLLEEAKQYWQGMDDEEKDNFRFLHVSTDEVYCELGDEGFFIEETPYDTRSPYSSSKASSDHLLRAWHHTYGLPTMITNCSNNYGSYQFPEKLIPVVILKALQGKEIPVYGTGEDVRDWLFVDDHALALLKVVKEGLRGETYNIGGHNEKQNIEVVHTICDTLNELLLIDSDVNYRDQISFVTDRPGHDFRYAIDASKIESGLGWTPEETFDSGIKKTIQWYLDNIDWCEAVTENNYDQERLGTA